MARQPPSGVFRRAPLSPVACSSLVPPNRMCMRSRLMLSLRQQTTSKRDAVVVVCLVFGGWWWCGWWWCGWVGGWVGVWWGCVVGGWVCWGGGGCTGQTKQNAAESAASRHAWAQGGAGERRDGGAACDAQRPGAGSRHRIALRRPPVALPLQTRLDVGSSSDASISSPVASPTGFFHWGVLSPGARGAGWRQGRGAACLARRQREGRAWRPLGGIA